MDEKEELNKKLQNKDGDISIQEKQEQSREADTLRSKVSSLEAEVQHLRNRSDMNLEEELKKAKNELKTKELDLFHVNFEKSKQLDSAMSKICELEKDVANYARKNDDLKAEIRSLRNREEPTTDLIHRRPPRLVKVIIIYIIKRFIVSNSDWL
jgi:chromosome segregation ATPase